MLAWFQSSREVAFLLTVVGAATMALTNRYFATASNFDSLQTILAVNGMIALGMMVLLIAGFFDLSVGSTMGLAGIVCAMLLHADLPIPLAVTAAVLFGAMFGLVNGVRTRYPVAIGDTRRRLDRRRSLGSSDPPRSQ